MAEIDSTILGTNYIGYLFAKERTRQSVIEGFTLAHDDEHIEDELAEAAATYALGPGNLSRDREHPSLWPFEDEWWKPDTTNTIDGRIDELVKAGALLIAEIQRLSRLKAKGETKYV